MTDSIGLLNRPSSFDGDKTKFDTWMMSCNLYMQYYADEIKTDRQKIIFMISYMRDGMVGHWAQHYYAKNIEGKTITFAAFLKDLQGAFHNNAAKQAARSNLFTICQGKETADEFISRFRLVAGEAEFDDAMTLEYFRRAIRPDLLGIVYSMETLPTTLTDWYKYVMRFDGQKEEAASILSQSPFQTHQWFKPCPFSAAEWTGPTTFTTSTWPGPDTFKQVQPMDIDQIFEQFDQKAVLKAYENVQKKKARLAIKEVHWSDDVARPRENEWDYCLLKNGEMVGFELDGTPFDPRFDDGHACRYTVDENLGDGWEDYIDEWLD